MNTATSKPSITLVLGSGSARGLAHIGVIDELEAYFDIRCVVGCSIGSVVGGFYAAGQLEAYRSWVTDLTRWDVLRFLDLSLTTRAGMMKGDLIMDKLRSLIGSRLIEELPIRFTAVASDIHRRKEVWLAQGELFDAMRASFAIPGIFTPLELNGRTLVDGGLLNPVPVAPATDDQTDLTLAVNLAGRPVRNPLGATPVVPTAIAKPEHRSRIDQFLVSVQSALGMESAAVEAPEEVETHLSLSDVLIGTFDTMQASITRYRLAAYPPDILIELPENICDPHDFHRASELIEAGRYWTRLQLERNPELNEALDGKAALSAAEPRQT